MSSTLAAKMTTKPNPCPSLLDLPGELRNQVYNSVLKDAIMPQDFVILLACRQINHEAQSIASAGRPFKIPYAPTDSVHIPSLKSLARAFADSPDGRPTELHVLDGFDCDPIRLSTMLDRMLRLPHMITVGAPRSYNLENVAEDRASALVAVTFGVYGSRNVMDLEFAFLQVTLSLSDDRRHGDAADQITSQVYDTFAEKMKKWRSRYHVSSLVQDGIRDRSYCFVTKPRPASSAIQYPALKIVFAAR